MINKVCIYGVGAVGGFVGTLLAKAGCEVSAVARGATLTALQTDGLRLQIGEEIIAESVTASGNPEELGIQDLVVIAVKAQSMVEVAQKIDPLIGPKTIVLTAMNGVPWWFFHGTKGECAELQLDSVDPGGGDFSGNFGGQGCRCSCPRQFCLKRSRLGPQCFRQEADHR